MQRDANSLSFRAGPRRLQKFEIAFTRGVFQRNYSRDEKKQQKMGQCNLTEAATRYVYYCRSAFQDCIDLFSVPVSFSRVSVAEEKKGKGSISNISGLQITRHAQ